MIKEDLITRTKLFSLRILKLSRALPTSDEGRVIAKQIIRSGTSVGANYRAACRGRSTNEFIAKLGTVIEEADETSFWLELIIEGGLMRRELIEPLLNETDELVAIFVSSVKTVKNKKS